MNTLQDLERKHNFLFLSKLNSIRELIQSSNVVPDVLFLLFSFIFKKNVMFFNFCEKSVHYFQASKLHVIQYQSTDCNCAPVEEGEIIILDASNKYQWCQIQRNTITSSNNASTSNYLYSMSLIGGRLSWSSILLKDLPNRQSSKVDKRLYTTVANLLQCLDPRYVQNQTGLFGNKLCLKTYLYELSLGSNTSHVHEYFDTSILERCKGLELSCNTLRKYLEGLEYDDMSHHFILPVICLKFSNLYFWVFVNKDKRKENFYYGFNHLDGKVECPTECGYHLLIDKTQILYLYSGEKKLDYFAPKKWLKMGKQTNGGIGFNFRDNFPILDLEQIWIAWRP